MSSNNSEPKRLPTYEPAVGGPHTCEDGHHLVADHNGEPVCCCSWNPACFPSVKSRWDAVSAVRGHVSTMNDLSNATESSNFDLQ